MKWSSLHIFYYSNLDTLLTDCILKLYKEEYIQTFFFIRYWNGGPHIRLRIADKNYNQILEIKEIIKEYLNKYPSMVQLSNEEYTLKSIGFSTKERVELLSLQNNNSILEMPYYPEKQKYIDENALYLSEMIFSISSVYALNLLNSSIKKSELYYVSMQHTMYILQFFIKENSKIVGFLESYFKYWNAFSEGKGIKVPKINKLISRGFLKYDPYFKNLKKMYNNNEVQGLIFNYIHLFNNRLGINTREEAFLAQCLIKYIREGEQ
ncbi:lantibiotic dehydratase C-terminal domain-containing protein [Staphylococcus agnetis]|uniref:lantibiotic dehydratase C-terminal domain-containing protein n=1 Tax=Staphylococcus agnetis TaxID=985762 RepID=UPI001573D8EA|nr:lantibiotic dehydratase C-terminal domain-containing protein [Staphylococcus agnetis]MBY7665197.1 hypothetical protein [Staphylococcus agnetis]